MRRQIAVLALLTAAALPAATAPARAGTGKAAVIECDHGPLNAPTGASDDLDRVSADCGVFCDRDHPTSRLRNVAAPAMDQEAPECAIVGGDPYAALHCYRNLVSEPSARTFALCAGATVRTSCGATLRQLRPSASDGRTGKGLLRPFF